MATPFSAAQKMFRLPQSYEPLSAFFPEEQDDLAYRRKLKGMSGEPVAPPRQPGADLGPQEFMQAAQAGLDPFRVMEMAKKIREDRETQKLLKELGPLDPSSKSYQTDLLDKFSKYPRGAMSQDVNRILNLKAFSQKQQKDEKEIAALESRKLAMTMAQGGVPLDEIVKITGIDAADPIVAGSAAIFNAKQPEGQMRTAPTRTELGDLMELKNAIDDVQNYVPEPGENPDLRNGAKEIARAKAKLDAMIESYEEVGKAVPSLFYKASGRPVRGFTLNAKGKPVASPASSGKAPVAESRPSSKPASAGELAKGAGAFSVAEVPAQSTEEITDLVIKGNLDPLNRKVLPNPDGSSSTAITIGVEVDGKEYVIPTVVDGVRLSNKDAFDHFKKTKQHFGAFKTKEAASTFADQLHQKMEASIAPAGFSVTAPNGKSYSFSSQADLDTFKAKARIK